MKYTFMHMLYLILICSNSFIILGELANNVKAQGCLGEDYPIRTLFLPRSAGSNTARRLAGWQHTLPGCDPRVDGDFNVIIEYYRSFDTSNINQYLFEGNCLNFVGTECSAQNNLPKNFDLRADDIGLPRNFVGNICFDPKIDGVVVDFLYHILLDPWLKNLYFKAFMPVEHTRWDLGIHKQTSNIPADTPVGFEPCYMSENRAVATTSICHALSGNFTFGDMKQPLNFGVFSKCRYDETRIADIEALFCYSAVLTCDTQVAPFVIVSIPTGNRPMGKLFFEPISGNGHHWELGGGFEGHHDLFKRDYSLVSIAWFGFVTYQFDAWQLRFFDVKNRGNFSRYLLLKELNQDCKYTGRLFNAIDFATIATRAGGSVRADISVKLSLYNGCWGWDIGYNFWALTEENICIEPTLFPSDVGPNQRLMVKGTQGVCQTTVKKSQLVDIRDVNIASARIPTQITNGIFTHISYTALNHWWEPQIGVGAKAEWAAHNKFRNITGGLNQWQFWVKFGFAF